MAEQGRIEGPGVAIMTTFERFNSRTFINAILAMRTALSVGSRASLEPIGTDLPVVKGPDGMPFIPGSSIKGVVRFQVERVLRTLDRKPDLWACDPFQDPCVSDREKEKLWGESKRNEAMFAEKVFDASCTACRMFGSPWFAGRVACKDAYLVNSDRLVRVTQVRDGVGIDRDLGAARSGIKYDFETVVPGSRFRIEIVAENLDDWELGLLVTVLNWWGEEGFAIGGKSTRGPGWGRLEEITIQRVTSENLLDYLSSGRAPSVYASPYLEAFGNKWRKGAGNA